MDKLKGEQNRSSTRRNYYCVWKSFNNFIISFDRKPRFWEDKLTLFVGFLIHNGKKSSTVRSYVSAVKAVLLDIDIELNYNQFLIRSLTRACRLINDQVRTRLPIYKAMLHLILQETLHHYDQQPYLASMYCALFTAAYYGLLRVGELTAGEHPIRAADVQIGIN